MQNKQNWLILGGGALTILQKAGDDNAVANRARTAAWGPLRSTPQWRSAGGAARRRRPQGGRETETFRRARGSNESRYVEGPHHKITTARLVWRATRFWKIQGTVSPKWTSCMCEGTWQPRRAPMYAGACVLQICVYQDRIEAFSSGPLSLFWFLLSILLIRILENVPGRLCYALASLYTKCVIYSIFRPISVLIFA